jgi:hypothetical protein
MCKVFLKPGRTLAIPETKADLHIEMRRPARTAAIGCLVNLLDGGFHLLRYVLWQRRVPEDRANVLSQRIENLQLQDRELQ